MSELTTTPGLRYADLLRETRPDGPTPELICGAIHQKASPRGWHAFAQTSLVAATLPAFRSGGGGTWWILVEPDVVLSEDTVLRPDIAGWQRSRLPTVPDAPIAVVPDWVCEVLSPGHERYDRLIKRSIYLEHRVEHVWFVDPALRLVEAYRLVGELYTCLGCWSDEDRAAQIPPFDDFEIDVSTLFVPRGDDPLIVAEAGRVHYG